MNTTCFFIKSCCENGNDVFTSNLFQVLLTFLGAFLGFGFSLWLYYKQNKKEKKKEEAQKRLHYIDLLKYYKELLSSIVGIYEKQLNLIDEFISNQRKNLTVLVPLNQVATEDFTRLKNIDNRGTFEAWIYTFQTEDTIITMLCKKARAKLQDVRFEMENIISELEKTRERTSKSLSIINSAITMVNQLA